MEWHKTFLPHFARNGNGAFVDTCIVHEQNVDYCSSQKVANCVGWNIYKAFPDNLTPQQAFYNWYFNQGGNTSSNEGYFFTLDDSIFPGGNKYCNSPYPGSEIK